MKKDNMRKLIEMSQDCLIVCDNPSCDFEIPNQTKDAMADISKYVNMPCPKCGENLLTEKDYLDSLKMLAFINWLNKWFSWITLFVPKHRKAKVQATAHVHNGIKVEKLE